jgi:hypothetical protein
MAENTKPEFRILVEDLPLRHSVVEMSSDEILVLQHVLDERAHLLAALHPWIRRKDTVTFTGKPFESIAHQITSSGLTRPTTYRGRYATHKKSVLR